MSVIDEVRVLFGVESGGGESMGGDKAVLSLLDPPTGKINMDWGRPRPDGDDWAGDAAAESLRWCDGDLAGLVGRTA